MKYIDKTVRMGIVGGGQLAMMMAQEAGKYNLPIEIIASDPISNCPVQPYINTFVLGNYKDKDTIVKIGEYCELITYEIELANASALEDLVKNGKEVYPKPQVLKIIQDKLAQSKFFDNHELPIPKYYRVDNRKDLEFAIDKLGLPLMIKSRFDSYDGKGNFKLSSRTQIDQIFDTCDQCELLAQEFIDFDEEVSVICVGSRNGTVVTYPVLLNKHGSDYHILHRTLMPAPLKLDITEQARKLAEDVIKLFNGVGVFTIEFLLTAKDLLINEVAPRVHNSGHLTIEACDYSQFYLHLLAGIHDSIPSPAMHSDYALMQNIIGPKDLRGEYDVVYDGQILNDLQSYDDRLFFHLYGKIETKPHRKLGHWVLLSNNQQSISDLESEADKILRKIELIPKYSMKQ